MEATVIEDVLGGYENQKGNSQPMVQQAQAQSYHDMQHPGYGLQMPQPLKQSSNLNQTSGGYTASSNTVPRFDNHTFNTIQTQANQSSAIRGKLTSPHIYQWDASPVQQSKQDLLQMAGMKSMQVTQGPRSLDPKQLLRDYVSDLYAGALMMKTHQYGAMSVYKCPVENLTGGDIKYVVAIVPNHEYVPLGSFHTLKSLPWVSFQTRTTTDPMSEFGPNRPSAIFYTIPSNNNNPLFDKINLVLEQGDRLVYMPDTMPCKIELLRRKENTVTAAKSSLLSALESFRCILTLHDTM